MAENTEVGLQIGATARWAAAVRAAESSREDRLFDDPWAAALAGSEGMEWLAGRPADSTLVMTLRTRYFDDFLLRVSSQEGLRQILVLAAGLDMRAFRLDWPKGIRLFELDQAEIFDFKEASLNSLGAEAACERRVVPADLTRTWSESLVASGFDSRAPSCWLLEGFLFYLPNEAITAIIEQISDLAAPGSWLAFDINNSDMMTSPWTRTWVDMQAQMGAPWVGTMDDPESFLGKRGWLVSLTQAGQPDANYGRWTLPLIPTRAPGMPHNWFVTAKKA
jgi:methyltransferase (TIGR00027 family)